MRFALIAAVLALGACTSTPAMRSALAPLDGQPIQTVIERLGPPSSTTAAGADTVYRWYRGKAVPAGIQRGYLASAAAPSPDAPTSGTYAPPAVPYVCDLMIIADGDGRIVNSYVGEEAGGCRETARKLNQPTRAG